MTPTSPSRAFGRGFTLLSALTLPSLLVPACLTPEFSYSEDDTAMVAGGAGPLGGHCENRTLDADETDIDCGGQDCSPCAQGRACMADIDCENESCASGLCQKASCTDGDKNNTETDVDCGGGDCSGCAAGKRCESPEDCTSFSCTSGICDEATCSDRVINQGETDLDCGGPNCDPCELGESCVLDEDCAMVAGSYGEEAACTDSICALSCAKGTADCNQDASDGCETDTETDEAHCGACGAECAPSNGTGECVAGACTVASCNTDFDDCDEDPENGCEADLNTSEAACGTCDTECTAPGGTPVCLNKSCTVSCDSCPERPHAIATCDEGPCVWSCEEGWFDLDGDLNAEMDSDGCEGKAISLLARDTTKGSGSSSDLDLSVTIDDDLGTSGHRMLLVAVTTRESNSNRVPTRVSFGGEEVQLVEMGLSGGADLFTGIYVLDECGIQKANGDDTVLVETGIRDWGGMTVDAILVENVEQTIVSPLSIQTKGATVSLNLDSRSEKSFFFASVASEVAGSLSVSTPNGAGATQSRKSSVHAGAGTLFDASPSETADSYSWTSSSGDPYWAAYGVELVPASSDPVCP